MSNSIYSIQNYSASVSYNKHDIIFYTDRKFYYAKQAVAAGTAPNYSNVIFDSDVNWGGYFRHPVSNKDYPLFLWKPAYQSQGNFEPKVSVIKYGDSYEKRTSDQINTDLLNLDLTFDGLTIDEATAILHFLHVRAAKSAFIYRPSQPFTVASSDAKLFICRKWTSTYNFYNNFTVKSSFEEIPA